MNKIKANQLIGIIYIYIRFWKEMTKLVYKMKFNPNYQLKIVFHVCLHRESTRGPSTSMALDRANVLMG
jgi:arginyl-tRNA--protein-N-Asp/Glu arginylyltransferase